MSFLEYAPAPESQAILNLRSEYGLFVDGEFREGHGTPFASISPATEKHLAMISSATSDSTSSDAGLTVLKVSLPGVNSPSMNRP